MKRVVDNKINQGRIIAVQTKSAYYLMVDNYLASSCLAVIFLYHVSFVWDYWREPLHSLFFTLNTFSRHQQVAWCKISQLRAFCRSPLPSWLRSRRVSVLRGIVQKIPCATCTFVSFDIRCVCTTQSPDAFFSTLLTSLRFTKFLKQPFVRKKILVPKIKHVRIPIRDRRMS